MRPSQVTSCGRLLKSAASRPLSGDFPGKNVVTPISRDVGWTIAVVSICSYRRGTSHYTEDGIKITEHDLPQPLPFDVAKVYFSHYHYHSALEVQELALYAPWEAYWRNTFPYSDERHWDNMGFEVFPPPRNGPRWQHPCNRPHFDKPDR